MVPNLKKLTEISETEIGTEMTGKIRIREDEVEVRIEKRPRQNLAIRKNVTLNIIDTYVYIYMF